MKYFGGCDVGSTYTKAVILDENGKMVADTTIKSKGATITVSYVNKATGEEITQFDITPDDLK